MTDRRPIRVGDDAAPLKFGLQLLASERPPSIRVGGDAALKRFLKRLTP